MNSKVVLDAEFATDEAAQAFMNKADALVSTAWFWIGSRQGESKPSEVSGIPKDDEALAECRKILQQSIDDGTCLSFGERPASDPSGRPEEGMTVFGFVEELEKYVKFMRENEGLITKVLTGVLAAGALGRTSGVLCAQLCSAKLESADKDTDPEELGRQLRAVADAFLAGWAGDDDGDDEAEAN